VARLKQRARSHPDWMDFDSYSEQQVLALYHTRGLKGQEIVQTTVWKIAQDLSGRIAISAGMARMPDYRDELQELIRERFPSRRHFCQATGISEDMLSHVLAGRKDLSLEALTAALGRVGFTLRIMPLPVIDPVAAREKPRKKGKKPA